jgi:hypothetical protein
MKPPVDHVMQFSNVQCPKKTQGVAMPREGETFIWWHV